MEENKNLEVSNLTPPKIRPYKCPYENCKSAFDRPYRLKQHLIIHKNVKAFKCTEENCSKAYTTKSHLNRHVGTYHKPTTEIFIFSCRKCLKTFSNSQNLKKHMNVIHNPERTVYTCANCNQEFNKKHQLTTHMYRYTGIKAFSCELCNKSFITLAEKKNHMRYHNTHTCSVCFQEFHHWSDYQKHKRNEHDVKEYICHHCNRKFKQRQHILHHMKIHYRKPLVTSIFKCHVIGCNKEYTRRNNLKQHIKIKHEKITHDCTICKAKLSTKAKLAYHLQVHERTEVKEFKPKTKAEGRKERKDKGTFKQSTALKIAGITRNIIEASRNIIEASGILESSVNEKTSEIVTPIEVAASF